MDWRLLGTSLFLAVGLINPALGDEQKFCATLKRTKLVDEFTAPGQLYYRHNGQITSLQSGVPIPRDVAEFFYHLRPNGSQFGQRTLLNVKYVFVGGSNAASRDRVQLRNDLWDRRLTSAQRNRILNDCSRLPVSGYERFHLQNSRDYCLIAHFHQRSPDFATLDTNERRRSFAFGDMLGDAEPNLFAQFFGSLGPRRAGADELTTNRYSHVRSWIKNFTYGPEIDRCVPIKTDFPEGVSSFALRIVNHGIGNPDDVRERTWNIRLLP